MGKKTAISWSNSTFNPWIGCTKVSDACKNCYAEEDNKERKWVPAWGTGVPRHRTTPGYWDGPLHWNRSAARTGQRPRIFCASLADVFDNEVPPEWRVDLWQLLRKTPNLRWMLLTKRIGNAHKMLPPDWPFPNAGLMATLENQDVWDRDFPKLMATPAVWHGVSCEPLLGHIHIGNAKPDWLITGGESGPNFRPLDMNAVRSLRDQCARNGIAFHHKQNGGFFSNDNDCLSTASNTRTSRPHWPKCSFYRVTCLEG
jgi:protein gp37